ncbi:MAG: fused MFS/spermidine synthase [Desulfovibrio sp.]|nr:fused MFS/spermidine synthase [Desulfovibrio sp.]
MLELTVFLCGALVMVLEMVGARVLAPHVGTSAIVWTSLIGVMLACLALGAWAGGRLADRKISRQGLALALSGAGMGSAFAAFCHTSVGQWAATVMGNLYAAAVLAALCILAAPAFFFGMVTPYAIRLRIERVDSSGATVGRLYALSTAGSIAGTFLGGFVLISFWGSTSILWGVACCLLALAMCHVGRRVVPCVALALAGIACGLATVFLGTGVQGAPGPDFLLESPYNSIRVFDARDYAWGGRAVRLLATDPGYCQSGMFLDAPDEPYFRYTQFYALGPYFAPQAERILMLGGGGYSVPKWLLSRRSPLAHPDRMHLTVVEIDPAMTETARRWFALSPDPRLTVQHEDARSFLNRQNERYDLVFVDVFNAHYAVPFQMGTIEAAAALRRAVAPGGLVLMNVISAVEGANGRLVQSICNALLSSFAEVRLYCAGEQPPDVLQNVMVLAFPEKRDARAAVFSPVASSGVDVAAMLATRYPGELRFATPALTDDFAPVERYTFNLQRP